MLFPEEISKAVQEGLNLCANTLLPTLFPFFVLSAFIAKSGLVQPIGAALERLMRPVFHLPGSCSAALVLGLIGGYPTGAKTAVSLYQEGQCSRQEAEYLLAFCNNCGPAFLLGSVGYGLFHSLRYGLLLAVSHMLSALLTGFLLAPAILSSDPRHHPHQAKQSSSTLPAAFVSSVTDAMHSFLNLSAFVLCFSAIIEILQIFFVPQLIASIPLWRFSGENNQFFLLGLLEMTCGVVRLDSGSETERLILTAALLGWGGLSVHCQVLSLLQDTDLSPVMYLKGKAIHAFLAALFTAVFLGSIHLIWSAILFTLTFIIIRMAKKSSGKKARNIL